MAIKARKYYCPHCGNTNPVPEQHWETNVNCTSCGQTFLANRTHSKPSGTQPANQENTDFAVGFGGCFAIGSICLILGVILMINADALCFGGVLFGFGCTSLAIAYHALKHK